MFSKALLAWFHINRRELPWRNTNDPYQIWISEIILQQTRVVQGYDYYVRFMHKFPDVYSLASASEDEVMKAWQGLGYYSRARNLHAAAKQIVEAGGFPSTYESIRNLKGVGDYTAAAISSFAYKLPYAVVDGNVYRVLSRYLGIDTPIDTTAGKKMFAQLAQEMFDENHPDDYNQAIMDFGALQCIPKNPDCLVCPLNESCLAYAEDAVADYPVKLHKTKVSNRYFHYLYVDAGDCTYVRKRTGNDIWRNLYEIPMLESNDDLTEAECIAIFEKAGWLDGVSGSRIRLVAKGIKHVLSHQILYADLYEWVCTNKDENAFKGFVQIKKGDIDLYAFPKLISQLLKNI